LWASLCSLPAKGTFGEEDCHSLLRNEGGTNTFPIIEFVFLVMADITLHSKRGDCFHYADPFTLPPAPCPLPTARTFGGDLRRGPSAGTFGGDLRRVLRGSASRRSVDTPAEACPPGRTPWPGRQARPGRCGGLGQGTSPRNDRINKRF